MTKGKKLLSKVVTKKEEPTSTFLLSLITAVLTIPVFIIVYGFLPEISLPIGNGFRIDHILIFLIVFVLIFYLVKKFRILVYGAAIIGLLVLTITNFSGYYGLKDLYHDYSKMLYSLQASNENIEFEEYTDVPFYQREALLEAVDYNEEIVINTARNFAVANFQDYEFRNSSIKMVQYFSIFKEVLYRWNYVFDPKGEDYFSKTSESVNQLSFDDQFKGDCDDFSIAIGGLIKAIGGEVRLVRTSIINDDGSETGHLYPEVKIGKEKELETAIYMIKAELFHKESKGKSVFYYKDADGYIWLNFDYNDIYPGGKYQSTIRESVLTL